MLNIYANTFLTATRTTGVSLRELPQDIPRKRRRWFSAPRGTAIDAENL